MSLVGLIVLVLIVGFVLGFAPIAEPYNRIAIGLIILLIVLVLLDTFGLLPVGPIFHLR